METGNIKYLDCPYCPKIRYKTRAPNSIGHYKVQITRLNWLIFKCARCGKKFKAKIAGSILTETDFYKYERGD